MEAVELAQTQRPVLDSGEKIVCVQNRVGLYKGDERDVDHDSGTVYLTTHRIVYVDQERPLERSVGLDLSRVLRSLLHSGFLYTSSKISLHLSAAPPAGRKRGLGGDGSQAGEGSGAGRPAHTRSQSSASARSWQCTICDCVNKGGGKCTLCGVPRPEGAAAKAPEVEMREATLRCPVCTFDNHTSMVQCEMCNSELWQPGPASSGSGSADAQAAGPEAAGGRGSVVKLSFRAGGASAFYSALREAIGGQAWVNGPAPALAAPGSVASGERRAAAAAAGGGISTIVSAAYESERARDVTLRSAFADLDALTAMADDIVGLAEHIAKQLHAPAASKLRGRGASDEDSAARGDAFRQYLLDLGIDSPVTRDTAGAVFHEELARELCDFLEHYVAQCGGSVALVDAYCLYNRAREFTPVYPADFVQACQKFVALRLPLRLREYPSGLLVLEDAASADDTLVTARVDSYIASFGPLTAHDLAAIEDCPLALAEERLWLAERAGHVCRDEGVEGVRFYANNICPW